MQLTLEHLPPIDRCRSQLERLRALFDEMDHGYGAAARTYGFNCRGCPDSCCRTRFDHHTVIEALVLQAGLEALAGPARRQVRAAAARVRQRYARGTPDGEPLRVMCPVNEKGRCRLYAQRPMICRLHGIPYELHRPGRAPLHGPGCALFQRECGQAAHVPFDRTGYYRRMAALEADLKAEMGWPRQARIRFTVADVCALGGPGAAPDAIRRQGPLP